MVLLDLLIVTLVLFNSIGVGRVVLQFIDAAHLQFMEELVLSVGLGLALLIFAMVVLGFSGLYSTGQAWGLVGTLSLPGLLGWRIIATRKNIVNPLRELMASPWTLKIFLALMALYGLGYLIASLSPTLEGDSIAGYLVTARQYAEQGGIVSVPTAYTDAQPANGQMLSTLGFLLRDQITAQLLVVWMPGLVGIAAIYVFGRKWFSRWATIVGMTVWYGMFAIGYLAASAKIDVAWAAFDLLSIIAFTRWYFTDAGQRNWKWLVVAGLFLGVAAGIKQASLFTGILFGIAIIYRLWQDRIINPRNLLSAGLLLGIPSLLAVVWVVRSYLLTGSPTFTGSGLPGESGVVGFFRTLWDMSMMGNSPGTEGNLGKSIGPTVLAAVPLLFVIRNVDRTVLHVLAFCLIMSVMWFLGVQRARHFLPTLGLFSILAGYVVVALINEKPLIGRIVVVLISGALLLNMAIWGYINFVGTQPIPYVLGLDNKSEYLQRNLGNQKWYPNYDIVSHARSLPDDARIVGLSTGNGFYLDRPLYLDATTEDQIPSAMDYYQQLKQRGISHVFINDFVVAKRNYQTAWLNAPSFQADHLEVIICMDGQCLYQLR